VVPLLDGLDVIVPDLRGFGASDKHLADPATAYSAAAQARSILALIEELGLTGVVLAGYDIGSRIAQAVAADRPGLLRALVVAPPLPGIGTRVLDPAAQQEFWYQSFHRLDLAEQLIDGRPDAVRTYLAHFWSPATVLWPGHDPLLPVQWSDRLGEFFDQARLRMLPSAGHFTRWKRPASSPRRSGQQPPSGGAQRRYAAIGSSRRHALAAARPGRQQGGRCGFLSSERARPGDSSVLGWVLPGGT
jgi:pimeloyl-ACP methyl ester carboxylesterase